MVTDSEAVLCHPAQDELERSVAFYKTLFTKMLIVAFMREGLTMKPRLALGHGDLPPYLAFSLNA